MIARSTDICKIEGISQGFPLHETLFLCSKVILMENHTVKLYYSSVTSVFIFPVTQSSDTFKNINLF